jgi:beta-N-acetylhexosaminidase
VRDLHRRHREAVEQLLQRHPDAILVEMGVPAYRPARARNYVATHGSARVCADAAADLMVR